MSNKKYETFITQQDSSWTAGIIRRVTTRKTTITKSQEGFASEAEAIAWADAELKVLLKVQAERNQRHAR
ncbi:DUF3622 domain-containing protein [Oceanicoccus sp. KOV_DT_Chl]|uniref:DUF3622 domain-containing protein n=1 Tax=Oceanicoccus sp. KOV_DT_Chl TaxID=1904639 RepID=UPI000C7A350D|nr:DUF3622 domain-containing protein [Oceanicoccus sp. KOV_DT_Chl]